MCTLRTHGQDRSWAEEGGITATFDKGLLKVTVSLTQAATPRKIAIGAEG